MNEEKPVTSDNKKLSPEEKVLDAFRTNDMMTSLIFGSSQEMDILPQMNTVPLQMQQTSSEMVRSL